MQGMIILLGILVWILLFCLVYFGGRWILESNRKTAQKKWKIEDPGYEYDKWEFSFYVIAFFVGIPFLIVIALCQELH